GAHGHRVDVSGGNTLAQQSCRRDCKHTCAGSDVQHIGRGPAFHQIIKSEETAAGRPVMTGAEGEGGLDLDADVIGSEAGPVTGDVNDETSGAHRPQSGKALRHPVVGGDPLDAERVRRGFAGRELDQIAQPSFVGRVAKMNRHLPATGIIFERGAGRVRGIEAFAKKSRKAPGGRFVARKTGDDGGGIHAAQDCPSHWRAQWLCRRLCPSNELIPPRLKHLLWPAAAAGQKRCACCLIATRAKNGKPMPIWAKWLVSGCRGTPCFANCRGRLKKSPNSFVPAGFRRLRSPGNSDPCFSSSWTSLMFITRSRPFITSRSSALRTPG